MIVDDVQEGDIGTVFEITLKDGDAVLPIDSATLMRMIFRKHDGAILEKPASFTTDGLDGKLQYVTVEGDLDQAGEWKVQAYVELPSWKGHSKEGSFTVRRNLRN